MFLFSEEGECVNLAVFLSIIAVMRQGYWIYVEEGKGRWRLSREAIRASFMGRVDTVADIGSFCDARAKLVKEKGIDEQPFIVAVGPSYTQISHYELVMYKGMSYQFSDIVSAIKATYQVYWALDSSYPRDCEMIWMFIQRALFRMTTERDKVGVPLRQLFADCGVQIEKLG